VVEAPSPRLRVFRTTKCFEGAGPFVVWSAAAPDPGGTLRKFHLFADARQGSFGVRINLVRGGDIVTGGAVVNILRKHAKTATIGRIFRDPTSGDIWLPIFVNAQAEPSFWLQLAKTQPPELRFVGQDNVALVRKSSQGSYTKRRTLATPLPAYPPGVGMEDLTEDLLIAASQLVAKDDFADVPAAGETTGSGAVGERTTGRDLAPDLTPTQPRGMVKGPLPTFQREARDRLTRRVKTLQKSTARLRQQLKEAASAATLTQDAKLLVSHLHRVEPKASQIVLSPEMTGLEAPIVMSLDPAMTPGQNLAKLYERAKKARRAEATLSEQAHATEQSLAAMTIDLGRLRGAELPLGEVAEILRRYKLSSTKRSAPAGESPSLPYRTYTWRESSDSAPDKPILIMVGKSAKDNDELCRLAKSNDYWLHALGSPGSHVIIPARQVRGEPTPALLRAAAILALHFSKIREDQTGEVCYTRRQFIKKPKRAAPGLWQVDKSQTLFVRYDAEELRPLLAMAEP